MKKLFIIMLLMFLIGMFLAQASNPSYSPKPQIIDLATGVSLEYAEQGEKSGTTILFIHGYTDSWHSFEHVINRLPGNIHAIAISLRGHGNSSKHNTSYNLPDFAADLAAFIKTKNLKNVILAGHSLGGLVVQQFELLYPQLTKAVIIMGSDASFKDNAGIPEFVSEINKLTDPIPYEFAAAFQKSTVYKPVAGEHMEMFIAETLKVPAHVWKSAATSLLTINFTKELTQVNKPCLIVWGDKDEICSKDDQLNLKVCIKNSKLIIYEGTGHGLHWEDPQRFVKDLLEFINQLPV